MVVEATSGSTATTATVAETNFGLDYETFLLMLTAEIQYQDPLEPMDSSQYVTQLAQLSQVEQSIQTNNQLENIYGTISAALAMGDVSMIGHDVTIESDYVELENSAALIDYELAETAVSTQAFIYNSDGILVRNITGMPTASGDRNTVVWDGLDAAGNPVSEGTYSVEILAADSEGNSIRYNTYASTTVEQVNLENGTTSLQLSNGETVLSTAILAIS